ncbi:malto-oligosyltrehalose trehalohydrolase [Horticoccus luteus]|uniref:Malto-oligosyltrehalose trehalohydrolase n=2 Tax=Horticoccus luteus TaxID=2862869 RepID=A0A8F9TWU3_9BACT|nr:malto-oligosyltrehalose trehalohydrolase [Horticoccus luteus]
MALEIRQADAATERHEMQREAGGYFSWHDAQGRPGDQYRFVLEDGRALPDVCSRFQPEGVHGPSECIDPEEYRWRVESWRRPSWRDQIVYELHVGTFTPEGTFLAAVGKLDHLRELGVTAIELMPVADFPGRRNWGYDGVSLYAPARCYGRPDDLRRLVDEAHTRGIAVVLDVVYNHLGPDGNYLGAYAAAYFHRDRETPWGKTFNLDGHDSGPVRDFFVRNAAYWLDEFRIDGLRLDATHSMHDESSLHLLAEIANAVHARGGFVIAEDERNTCTVLRRPDGTGHGIDAVWADDFHHQVRVALTGQKGAYFANYTGTMAAVAETLREGWFYRGQSYPTWGHPRGEPCAHLPVSAFVWCIENHDQVGNRARGERLEHLVSGAVFRAATMLLTLAPYVPLLFMGQEWGASAPFLFFTDHHGELGRLVSEGRRREFGALHGAEESVPDPQKEETFLASKLNWGECAEPAHATLLEFYRSLFRERKAWLQGDATDRANWDVAADGEVLTLHYRAARRRLVVAWREGAAISGKNEGESVVLHSEEARFGGAGEWTRGPAAVLFATEDA